MKQDRRKQIIALLLAASIVSLSATGCAQQRPADSASAQQEQQQPEQQPESAAQTPDSTEAAAQPEEAPPSEQAEQPEQDEEPVPGLSDQETADSGQTGELTYIQQLAQDIADELVTPEMSEYEKVKTLFDYMLDTTAIGEPIGIEIWRVRGNYTEPPSYLEQRALSVLLYHVGMCEDYAAALTLLYRAAGLQAEYVPGITYSAEGPLVDHYWTMVMVDRQWYHVDPQLEDNISRHGYVRYRYFMRGRSIHASHWWGQNLIDSGMLTPPPSRRRMCGSTTSSPRAPRRTILPPSAVPSPRPRCRTPRPSRPRSTPSLPPMRPSTVHWSRSSSTGTCSSSARQAMAHQTNLQTIETIHFFSRGEII